MARRKRRAQGRKVMKMTGRRVLFPLALCLALVIAADGALAWHLQDEVENVLFASHAGDPRYETDTTECREAAKKTDVRVSCVALYLHARRLVDLAAVNVQRPPDCLSDLAAGPPMPGIELFWPYNRALGHPFPSFVEYDRDDCRVSPGMHGERGLAGDLQLSSDVEIIGHWFLSADTLEVDVLGLDGHDHGLDFGAMPCLTVRMALEAARYPGSGVVIAEGTTTKTVVSMPTGTPSNDTPVQDLCPGATGTITLEEVTEFRVEMGRSDASIPTDAAFVILVNWYQHDGGGVDSGQSIVQREWNRHAGADHPNRIVLPLVDPIRVVESEFAPQDDVVHISFHVLSSFAAYDLDFANTRLVLYDEDGHRIPLQHLGDPVVRYADEQDGHYRPVAFHYTWGLGAEGLPTGDYVFAFAAPGWQHTSEAHALLPFSIPPAGAPASAPAPPVLLFLVALAVLTALRRPLATTTLRT